MNYFKPEGNRFVGDCMPFFDGRTFHLYYLLDEGHHQARGGLGGHQWAHASTTDLVRWQHHPLALAIEEDWEAAICTGSVILHEGTYHAFYATRKPDWTQHLGHAVSSDGVRFRKIAPNPFASPPAGYSPTDFRDPCAFRGPDGRFRLLVTSRIADYPLHDRGGCLVSLTSPDLEHWEMAGPLLVPGGGHGYGCVPECPDWFAWNGRHYLIFGLGLETHYRISREPLGPWLRPPIDTLDGPWCAVMKTAPFGAGRRLGAAWVPCREDDKDAGGLLWGGNAIFREIVQNADGTLGTRFVDEMLPAAGRPLDSLAFEALTPGVRQDGRGIVIDAAETLAVAAFDGLPRNVRIRGTVHATGDAVRFGLGLRGTGRYESQYSLCFDVPQRRLSLAGLSAPAAVDLTRPLTLDVILRDDILDVCVDGRQTLVNRCPELRGDRLFFFCDNGRASFSLVPARLTK